MAAKDRKNAGCVKSGYMYAYEGRRNWRRSSQERWETVAGGTRCGTIVGSRVIDGSRVTVVRAGKKFYAALPRAVRKGYGR